MPFEDLGGLRVFRFESLASPGIVHGVFTRRGGVSPAPWSSLNLGAMVGDDLARVRENRRLALEALGRTSESVFDVWQVHSAEVILAAAPRGDAPLQQADAMLTDRAEVTLMMRFADCVPILLFDPERRAIGIVHAGWKGTLLKAPAAAVKAMVERYGCHPADIVAGLGPSIGPCHYAVGPEVVAQTRAAFPSVEELLLRVNGGHHLDLWAANARALREVGVEQLETSRLCTACRTDEFFSHRGEKGKTGRFGALIALR